MDELRLDRIDVDGLHESKHFLGRRRSKPCDTHQFIKRHGMLGGNPPGGIFVE